MNENDTATVMHQFNTDKRFRLELDPKILLPLLAFCEKNIVRYVVLVISMIPIVNVVSGFIIPTLYTMLFLMYLKKYGSNTSLKEIGVLFFVIFAIAISCLLYPVNASYILNSNNFWNTIFPCLRFYIVGLVIIPNERIMSIIGKASCLAILVETLFVIVYMMPRGLLQSDDMSRAYQILPNILFSLNLAYNKKEISAWVCSLIGIIYVCSMGSRGPLIIIIVYCFVKFLQHNGKTRAQTLTMGTFFVLIGIIFINSNLYLTVLSIVRSLFISLGLSTRVIDLALSNEIVTHTSGRDEIYDLLKQKISERPVLGYGVYGEWQWVHWNAHNMYLEILVHYGVILGSVLLIWLIYTTVHTYSTTPNKASKDMILMWGCFVFVKGIFGGSYLQFGVFYLIGFCLREIRRVSGLSNEALECYNKKKGKTANW